MAIYLEEIEEPVAEPVKDKYADEMVRLIDQHKIATEQQNAAFKRLQETLAASGNKVITAHVQRGPDNLITSITMQVKSADNALREYNNAPQFIARQGK
jgi:hypothetical protein